MKKVIDGKIAFSVSGESFYDGAKINFWHADEIAHMPDEVYLYDTTSTVNFNKKFWLSIKKAKDCLFSRRNGYEGKIICKYSIRLRLFNYELI